MSNVTWPSRARLADGREILFYDEVPTNRVVHDPRDLNERAAGSELRFDRLAGEWVAIAGHRQARIFKPPADQCPLCPSRDGRHTEVPAPDYDVVVFENRFPAFAAGTAAPATGEPFLARPGRGRCEVVCFTSDHDLSFVDLAPDRVVTVLRALADRTRELNAMDGVRYVMCFENRGEEIGVTLLHPHGQIYALPIVPPRIAALAAAAEQHHIRTGECLQCAVLADELAAADRVVTASADWVAYVPFAARWPYQVRLVPRRHRSSLGELDPAELVGLAAVYQEVLARFDRLDDTGPVPYIASWQQAPVHARTDPWHLAAEIFTIRRAPGRLKYLAGMESGAGLWINDIPPEVAAERLRDARPR